MLDETERILEDSAIDSSELGFNCQQRFMVKLRCTPEKH